MTTIRWSPSDLPELVTQAKFGGMLNIQRTPSRSMHLRSFAADPFASILVGSPAAIDPVDWDSDGDVDIIIGDGTGLRYFERSKDGLTELLGAANPFVGIVANDPRPEAADLDGDGDMDLLLGDATGRVRYFECRGAELLELSDSPTSEVQAVGTALPTVGDVNYDGVLDLLVDVQSVWSLVQGEVPTLVPAPSPPKK